MKRIIAILLTVLLLGMLTACDQNVGRYADGIIKADKATFEIGKTHSSFEGMNIQIANAIWDDEEIKLDVNWINKTGYDVVYGSSYDIERENNGEWSSCVTLEDLAFTSIGYELKAGATQKKTYNLTDVFDISQDGKYRLTTDCFIYDKGRGGKSTECELWVEFTVTRIGDTSGDVKKTFVDFVPQYIRTNGYYEDVEYPVVKIIRSVDELNSYYNENKEKYSLERREDPASDSTIGFLDACDKYNAEYFEKQILVMVLLEEGSGSVRHNVDNVKYGSDGKLYVSIRRDVPEVGTADMAEWHILIEMKKDVIVASESDVIVYLDGVNPKTQPATVRENGKYAPKTASDLNNAIAYVLNEKYRAEDPVGLIHIENYYLLANETASGTPLKGNFGHMTKTTVYLLVYHMKYSFNGDRIEEYEGNFVPTAITFNISESGEYTLEEYWTPRTGTNYEKDVRNKFPGDSADNALNSEKFAEDLIKKNWRLANEYFSQTKSS